MSGSKYTFVWKLEVKTNKNNKKFINIKVNANELDIARGNIINDILKLSRYGIPCYVFNNQSNKYKLTYIDAFTNINDNEFFEITSYFTNHIHTPPIDIIKNIPVIDLPTSTNYGCDNRLNINAKPFVPGTSKY
jgi:hypothetical protein